MNEKTLIDIGLLLIFAGVALLGWFWRGKVVRRVGKDKPTKGQKRSRLFATAVIVFGVYLVITRAVYMLFGPKETEEITFSIWAERTTIFGLDISRSVVYSWCIMVALVLLALILRFTVLRNFKDVPSGMQNALEAVVDIITGYVDKNAHGIGEVLASYIFSIGLFLVGCACVELLGFRTPASDIAVTIAMGVLTFFLINWYGIKKKGVVGRIKSMSSSNAALFVLKVITDLAIPVSMACRLFGNMLAGFVIMDLLYVALGTYAVGIPSVIGLYFSVAHPLLQIFIFVTLTLTFINEAVE
jgi:F-type H+-transporting ATPase subunit a